MRWAGEGCTRQLQPGPRACTEILDVEGGTHIKGAKMALTPCSHQVQLIPQAWKGLDTPNKGGQAITPPGTGQGPPGPDKPTTATTSFPDTLDSIKSNCQ